MIESNYLEINNDLIKKLKRIPALKVFDNKDFNGLISLSKIRKYDPFETIIKEGEYDSWIYFLISGKVNVVKDGKKLASLNDSGDIFGEMAIIDESPRSASIIAEEKTTCLASDISYIDRLDGIDKFRFGYFLYKTLSKTIVKRLRLFNECMINNDRVIKDSSENIVYLSDKTNNFLILKSDICEVKVTSGSIIGRHSLGKDILETNDLISRLHFRILFFSEQWHIEDLNSKNGTYLNKKKLNPFIPTLIKEADNISFSLEENNEKDINFIVIRELE